MLAWRISYRLRARLAAIPANKRGGFDDPYQLLSLDSGASEQVGFLNLALHGFSTCSLDQDIKRSYRKLAKVYHPDVAKNGDDGSTFLRLTDAYEFLLARLHGKDPDSNESGGQWDFHDWYWNFRIKRTWEKQQSATSETQSRPPVNSSASNPQAKAAVRSQLAGLRQRAAVRSTSNKAAESPPPTPQSSKPEDECDEIDEDEPCVLPDPPSHIITISTIEEDDDDESVFRDEGENFSSSCGARVRPRRVFVASSGDRENLVGQLHGLKRRATMSQQGL